MSVLRRWGGLSSWAVGPAPPARKEETIPNGQTEPAPEGSWRAWGVGGVASRCCSAAIAESRLACFRKLARLPGTWGERRQTAVQHSCITAHQQPLATPMPLHVHVLNP